MQSEAAGSNSGVTDETSLNTALYPFGYSDTLVQNQNQLMPVFPSLQDALISLTNEQRMARVTVEDAPLPAAAVAYPFESGMNPSTFESTNYSYGSMPPEASFFNKFIASQSGVQLAGNSDMNEWIMRGQGNLISDDPGLSRFSNELSLSLAGASQTPAVNGNSIQDQGLEMSSSGITSYSMHKQPSVGLEHTCCSSNTNNLSLSCNSYKPLHLSQLLSGSSFLQAMQEILAEIACFALENLEQINYSANGTGKNMVPLSISSENGVMFHNIFSQEREVEAKKKRLLSLLQVVDDQYNQCLDEIHTVISAFHAVTELDPNLHARFALPTISLMYKNLRERISSHILTMGSHESEGEAQAKEDSSSSETSFIPKQWALQQLRKKDPQLWRPQRGLPERSVSVLRAWMFQNFLHPYPKDTEKHLLALKSGLTRSQVSNWFINARVRLWKPMIEEMYAEMNRRKARRNDDEEANGSNRTPPMRLNHTRLMD